MKEVFEIVKTVVPVIISLSLLLISSVYYIQTVKKKNQDTALEFLNEWRDFEFRESQKYVLNVIARKAFREGDEIILKGYTKLDKQDKIHVMRVSFFFDYVGNMIAAKAVDEKLLLTVLAKSVVRHWLVLRPFVYSERQMRLKNDCVPAGKYSKEYQAGFEHLYIRALSFSQNDGLKHLKDKEMREKPLVISDEEINSSLY